MLLRFVGMNLFLQAGFIIFLAQTSDIPVSANELIVPVAFLAFVTGVLGPLKILKKIAHLNTPNIILQIGLSLFGLICCAIARQILGIIIVS